MSLAERIESEANIADRPGQYDRLMVIAAEVRATETRLLERLLERTRGKWKAEDARDRMRAELLRLAAWCESQRVSPAVADLRSIAGMAERGDA